jgi:rubrerythrin
MSEVSCRSTGDIVNFAIEKEQKAMDFYKSCAERAKNPGLKKFFEELVVEEQRHRDMLAGLEIEGIGGIKLEKVENLHISDYLVDVQFRDDLTYQEALTLAMKKEEKAHAFYSSWKTKCMHEKTANLFELLANEELKHKRNIEAIYDEEILAWD